MLMRLLPAIAIALAATAAAAQPYPSRPVRMVVPYAAGGLPDTMARLVAQRLTEKFAQPVIVDNRPGAGGIGACELVAKASPDGHTVLIADTPQTAVNLALYTKLPYDTLRDFAPVSIIGTSTQFLTRQGRAGVRRQRQDVHDDRGRAEDRAGVGREPVPDDH